MKLIKADSKKLKKKMLGFYREQYRKDPLRRDSMSALLKGLIDGTSIMTKSAFLEPVMVVEGESILMIALLAQADRMHEIFQIAFLESSGYQPDAFILILTRAEGLALERGAAQISGALNLHVNYGLGYLADSYDKIQSFGMSHSPDYIHDYFLDTGFEPIELVSYKKDMRGLEQLMGDGLRDRISQRYHVRELDLTNLESEAKLYTEINNKAFSSHQFYYKRVPEEDLELFRDFRFLLKSENLVFAYRGDEPVGFMLWYPDFHQLIKPGETIGIRTVLRNKLHPERIDTFKIVEMGIVTKEQGRGAILALFQYCLEKVRGRYDFMESGWVMEQNLDSRSFGIKWADGEARRYTAYLKELSK
jgi:hypothetical protein